MRPIRLQVQGYTCFKDEVVVDFDGLDLFVISGATGSGKSSLLDAMTFALFGEVPRTGKQEVTDLISLGRDRVAVLFDFRVGEQSYRISRTRRKKARPRFSSNAGNRMTSSASPRASGKLPMKSRSCSDSVTTHSSKRCCCRRGSSPRF